MYSVDELRQKVNYYWSATLGARTVTEIDSYKKDIDTLENDTRQTRNRAHGEDRRVELDLLLGSIKNMREEMDWLREVYENEGMFLEDGMYSIREMSDLYNKIRDIDYTPLEDYLGIPEIREVVKAYRESGKHPDDIPELKEILRNIREADDEMERIVGLVREKVDEKTKELVSLREECERVQRSFADKKEGYKKIHGGDSLEELEEYEMARRSFIDRMERGEILEESEMNKYVYPRERKGLGDLEHRIKFAIKGTYLTQSALRGVEGTIHPKPSLESIVRVVFGALARLPYKLEEMGKTEKAQRTREAIAGSIDKMKARAEGGLETFLNIVEDSMNTATTQSEIERIERELRQNK